MTDNLIDTFLKVGILIMVVIALILVIIGAIMFDMAENLCEKKCDNRNAFRHETISNGLWNINDYCTCFYKKGSETFVLGK